MSNQYQNNQLNNGDPLTSSVPRSDVDKDMLFFSDDDRLQHSFETTMRQLQQQWSVAIYGTRASASPESIVKRYYEEVVAKRTVLEPNKVQLLDATTAAAQSARMIEAGNSTEALELLASLSDYPAAVRQLQSARKSLRRYPWLIVTLLVLVVLFTATTFAMTAVVIMGSNLGGFRVQLSVVTVTPNEAGATSAPEATGAPTPTNKPKATVTPIPTNKPKATVTAPTNTPCPLPATSTFC